MASIVRIQPFRRPLSDVTREFDRVVERMLDDSFIRSRLDGGRSAPAGAPANLYEADDAYLVELPIPGVRPDDIDLTVEQEVLTLKATRAWETPAGARTIWQGFPQGEWQQQFTLPGEVDTAAIEATLDQGVLRLHLPKARHARPHTIRVSGGSRDARTVDAR